VEEGDDDDDDDDKVTSLLLLRAACSRCWRRRVESMMWLAWKVYLCVRECVKEWSECECIFYDWNTSAS
jgi:hypothetical protein